MSSPTIDSVQGVLRSLPSVDEALRSEQAGVLSKRYGRKQLTEMVRRAIADVRQAVIAGERPESLPDAVARALDQSAAEAERRALTRVINATGVVIHTNLGRAPLSESAKQAVLAAAGACTLEFDLETGKRGRRAPLAERMICDLTGAEAALVVNNCAAAAFFVLKALASGGEVIVSRGELVEIGGDFRVPEILAQSGAEMREVGTTNRTKLSDYDNAISGDTRVIMRVHPSNYRIVGFTEQPTLAEVARLARERSVVLFEDLGSGALVENDLGEPSAAASIAAGADIVTFSGDKLLGGPQCGIIAGREKLIDLLRKHSLYRALRVDKLVSAALEATLAEYVNEGYGETVPVQRMLLARPEEIAGRAAAFIEGSNEKLAGSGYSLSLIEGSSAVGGGAAPEVKLQTTLIAVEHASLGADAIAEKLRSANPPVIARIESDRVLIDLRTVAAEDEPALAAAVEAIAA